MFTGLTTAAAGVSGGAAAVLGAGESGVAQVALGVGGGLLGLVLLAVVLRVFFWVRAPASQLRELRDEIPEQRATTEASHQGEIERLGEEHHAEVERLENEVAGAERRIAELEAPEDDPDPHIALANRAEHRAAQLRALCVKWGGRIEAGERRRVFDVMHQHANDAFSDSLAEYEREHSVETYEVFDQLVGAGVLDAKYRGYIEAPRFLDDLRTAADQMQEAAKRLRVQAVQEDFARRVGAFHKRLVGFVARAEMAIGDGPLMVFPVGLSQEDQAKAERERSAEAGKALRDARIAYQDDLREDAMELVAEAGERGLDDWRFSLAHKPEHLVHFRLLLAVFTVLAHSPTRFALLLDHLTTELDQEPRIREALEGHPPDATGLVASDEINDVFKWVRGIETDLDANGREWVHDFRAAGAPIPDELDPDEVTVGEALALLSAYATVLGRIVRDLQERVQ